MAERIRYRTAQANKKFHTWSWSLAGLLALASSLALASLVACSPAASSPEREPTATEHSGAAADQGTPKATEPRPTNTPPAPSNPTLQAMIEHAQDDLARQLGIETSQITVVEAEPVQWRDSSLGCPQPDVMYAQVITPGYRIVLEVGEKTYDYHTDQRQAVVLCSEESQDLTTEQDTLPIFVQMVQVLLPPGSSLDAQGTDPAPNSVFAYDPAHQILLLRPSIDVSPEAQVLIGQTTSIRGPAPSPARGELFQIPPDETSPIEVIAVDAETDALTLAYAGQVFELLSGQSRSFKQAAGQATEVTVVTHMGRPASIEPFPYSPDAR